MRNRFAGHLDIGDLQNETTLVEEEKRVRLTHAFAVFYSFIGLSITDEDICLEFDQSISRNRPICRMFDESARTSGIFDTKTINVFEKYLVFDGRRAYPTIVGNKAAKCVGNKTPIGKFLVLLNTSGDKNVKMQFATLMESLTSW